MEGASFSGELSARARRLTLDAVRCGLCSATSAAWRLGKAVCLRFLFVSKYHPGLAARRKCPVVGRETN